MKTRLLSEYPGLIGEILRADARGPWWKRLLGLQPRPLRTNVARFSRTEVVYSPDR
jgi:hypothetical protein